MAVSALSKNLAALRQQLEGSKGKVKDLEGAMREKASKTQGEHTILLAHSVAKSAHSISDLLKQLLIISYVFAFPELNERLKSLQDEHRAQLEKYVFIAYVHVS